MMRYRVSTLMLLTTCVALFSGVSTWCAENIYKRESRPRCLNGNRNLIEALNNHYPDNEMICEHEAVED